MRDAHCRAALGAAVVWAGLAGVSEGVRRGQARAFKADSFEKVPSVAAMTEVGRELFFDASLSASGKIACASCHDPKHAFGPPNDAPVQPGGVDGHRPKARRALACAGRNIPPFTEHFFEDEEDDGIDQGLAGGHLDEAAASTIGAAAAVLGLMANTGADDIVALACAASGGRLRETFFWRLVSTTRRWPSRRCFCRSSISTKSLRALSLQQAKYAAWLRHRACSARANGGGSPPSTIRRRPIARPVTRAACRPVLRFRNSRTSATPRPRCCRATWTIPANSIRAGPIWVCAGLSRARTSSPRLVTTGLGSAHPRRCIRRTCRVFFHNGVFHRLDQAVRFYAERDTQPQVNASFGGQGRHDDEDIDDLPAGISRQRRRSAAL